jgi:hypothetical protein
MSRTELLFRASLLISLLITFGIGITSVLLGSNILLLFFAAILTVLLIITLRLGEKLRCRDAWAPYNELILNQRNILAWYVSNAMHGFNPPAYQLILVESLYEKGRTLHTELAKLKMIAEEEARKEIATEIQMQLDEWEVIILQLQNRIDELAPKHRL